MNSVTLSPKYQVVIPKKVRESLKISTGTKFEVIAYDGRIELIPIKDAKKLKGMLKGINTTIIREKDRL